MLPSVDGSDATLFRTPSSPAATQPSTKPTDTSTVTQTPCPTCNINRVAHQNDLVAAGVIPESLANILMSPALERKEKVRCRIPLPACVITSDEYFDLLVERKTEEKEKAQGRDGKGAGKETSPGGQKAKAGTSSD